MAEFDVLVRAGTVVDGTRMPRYVADIGISDGRIAEIGRIAAHRAAKVIEADVLIVAPGFVHLHTHYDAQLFWDPCFSISSWHGVKSVVIGNCGFGFAPMRPGDRERAMLTALRNFGYVTQSHSGEWRRVQCADDYRNVLVNGQATFEDGQPTGCFSGKLLRHGE